MKPEGRRTATKTVTFLALVLAPLGVEGACASHVPAYALDEGGIEPDAQPSDAPSEAGTEGELADVVSHERTTRVRFAVWWPYLFPADFCLAPATPPRADGEAGMDADDGAMDAEAIDWRGPVLAQAAAGFDGGLPAGPDAGLPAVSFPFVSSYLEFPAGSYVVRAILAGATDCAKPVLPDQPLSLANGASTTVAVIGYVFGDAHVSIVGLTDDTEAPRSGISLRFVSASSHGTSLSLAEGIAGSPSYAPLFTGVPFGTTGDGSETDAGKVDTHGYLPLPPISDLPLTLTIGTGQDAGQTLVVTTPATIEPRSVATVAAVGGTQDPFLPPTMVLCFDTARPPRTLESDCTVVSPVGGDAE